ncbi:hypothetical protein I5U56_14895 [Stenotrophomonas maltophilia]|nr:hypothetical protein [Stenotrophomonas maltophilia]MBH1601973.1 hypothetical protein [Stenotrophomonas maltophilia]
MAMLRTGQTAAPPIKAADDAWFESRTVTKPVGPKTPTHRPPLNANGLPTGATQGDAGWQAQNTWLLNGLSNPRHPFSVARQEIPAQQPNAKKLQNRRLPVLTLSALSHTVLSQQTIAPQWS